MTLTVELIDRPEAFARLAPEWNAALRRSPQADIGLTHEWLSAAWSFLGRGRTLFVLLLRDGARLAGALPLSLETQHWRGLPVRRLGLLTDPVTGCVHSDCFIDGDAAAAARVVGEFLRRHQGRWEVAELDSLPETGCLVANFDSFALALGSAPTPPKPHWRLQSLVVRGSWTDFVGRHGPRARERLRRERTRLERSGRAEVEFATEPAAVARAVDGFLALERRSKKCRRGDYTPLDARLADYYRRQFCGLAASDCALVASLRIGGETVASTVGTRFAGTFTDLNDLFDEGYSALAPGNYLRGELIRHCWTRGYERIDFNGHGAHFERWLSTGRNFRRALVYSPSIYARMLRFGQEQLLPQLRARLPGLLGQPRPAESPARRGLPATPEGA